jgi:WD40 repeat protein
VVAVAFTTDGETLLSASCDKTVKLWRVSTAEEIVTLSGHVDSVSAVAVSKVTQLIASGSRDKTIKLWQLVEQHNS